MRYVVGLALIFTVACGSDKHETLVAGQTIPSSCTLQSSGNHWFQDWGLRAADSYDCAVPVVDKMTCTFYDSGEHRELMCATPDGIVQGMPSACASLLSSGTGNPLPSNRPITPTDYFPSAAYDCGTFYSLRCYYVLYTVSGVDYEDFRCTD